MLRRSASGTALVGAGGSSMGWWVLMVRQAGGMTVKVHVKAERRGHAGYAVR